MKNLDKIKKLLNKINEEKPAYADDDFNANDWAGGNIDDAYNIGYNDGRISLAHDILTLIEE